MSRKEKSMEAESGCLGLRVITDAHKESFWWDRNVLKLDGSGN